MKKLAISTVVIAATMLFFTSCQKENSLNKSEEDQIEQSLMVPERDNSNYSIEKIPNLTPKVETNNMLKSLEKMTETLSTRGANPIVISYPCLLPEFNASTLYCGNRVGSTTVGRANRYSDNFYQQLGFSSNLNGGDKVFYFNASEESIVNFYLSNAHQNLSMMLLKGHYVWNNGVIEERFDEVEAYTVSHDMTSDRLANLRLTTGKYMLIVDSNPLEESSFILSVSCSPVNTSCNSTPGYGLFQDKFDNYTTGYISPQSSNWNKWNNNRFDGEVINNGGGKILKVDYKEGYNSNDQADFILDLGPRTSGSYQLEFDMWLYDNNTAYLSLQKTIREDVGALIYINKNGQGSIMLNEAGYKNFTFPTNKWAKVRFDVNLNANITTFYIDGVFKATWPCTASLFRNSNNTRLFRGVNFLISDGGLYYINNVCFIQRF